MKMTVYQITCGKKPNSLLLFVDNNIPMTFLEYDADIKNSIIEEHWVLVRLIPIIRKICKNTSKEAILNCNHKNVLIKSIARLVIGREVTWINCSLKRWIEFIEGIEEYSHTNDCMIEIDNPIDLKDESINEAIQKGIDIRNIRLEELSNSLNKRGK